MKSRKSFVSNSSSSSFIITGSNILEVATVMHKYLISDWFETDPDSKKRLLDQHERLKQLCSREDVLSGENGVMFKSCNYDTYLITDGKRVLIDTCNNHDWSECWLDHMNVIYHSGDYSDDDDCCAFMNGHYFYPNSGDDCLLSKELSFEACGKEFECPICSKEYKNPQEFLYYFMGKDKNKYCSDHFIKLQKVTSPDKKE